MTPKIVNNQHILLPVLWDFIVSVFQRPSHFRYYVVRSIWQLIKESSAPGVESISVGRIAGLEDLPVEIKGVNLDRLLLTALSKKLAPKMFFEIGTYLGNTTYAVAHNNPQAQVYTLDLPDADSRHGAQLEMTDEYLFQRWERGAAFKDTPEAARIQKLQGDSATFDFSPYHGKMDLIFIDASHSYSYVKADTEAALKMLSPGGAILWHDYPTYPGIYAYINELAQEQSLHIVHPLGTGLAIYCRQADWLMPANGAAKQHPGDPG